MVRCFRRWSAGGGDIVPAFHGAFDLDVRPVVFRLPVMVQIRESQGGGGFAWARPRP